MFECLTTNGLQIEWHYSAPKATVNKSEPLLWPLLQSGSKTFHLAFIIIVLY